MTEYMQLHQLHKKLQRHLEGWDGEPQEPERQSSGWRRWLRSPRESISDLVRLLHGTASVESGQHNKKSKSKG